MSSALDGLVWFVGSFVDVWVVLTLFGLFAFRAVRDLLPRQDWWEWLWHPRFSFAFIAAGLAGLVSLIIKKLVHSPRPFVADASFEPLFTVSSLYDSFPSGHTAFFFALAFGAFALHRRSSVLILLAAMGIALSRIIAGVHYPVDILGGIIIAALSVWLSKALIYPYLEKVWKRMRG